MTSSFEHHGLKHLSASSLNLWAAMPGMWALRYLSGFKEFMGPAAARGTAVEVGLVSILRGEDRRAILNGAGGDLALHNAYQTFDQNIQGELSEEIDDERSRIPGMLEQCRKWKPPGELLATQIKIEFWLDHISIPLIGYVDLSFS